MLSLLSVVLAAAGVVIDVTTWIQLNIAMVYSLPLVLAAAGRNRRLLWGLAAVLVAVTFVVYWRQSVQAAFALDDEYFINRLLAAVNLLLAAGPAARPERRYRGPRSAQQAAIRLPAGDHGRNRELDLQRVQAEEARDRKTRLLISVSHGVRSPLAAGRSHQARPRAPQPDQQRDRIHAARRRDGRHGADRGRGLAIRVADTRPGIASKDLERIFDEFTRLGRPDAGERPGWGLGLAICRRLTRLMGGEITVESDPGSGSVFTVKLPPSRLVQPAS